MEWVTRSFLQSHTKIFSSCGIRFLKQNVYDIIAIVDKLLMYQIYSNIMDSRHNPLSALPPAQRLQAMLILSVMWSTIFCLTSASWLWYGELVVGHVLVILGIAITAMTFRAAAEKKQNSAATYRDHPRSDGTSRYDDVWGG